MTLPIDFSNIGGFSNVNPLTDSPSSIFDASLDNPEGLITNLDSSDPSSPLYDPTKDPNSPVYKKITENAIDNTNQTTLRARRRNLRNLESPQPT